MCCAQYDKVTIIDESPSYISTLHAINILSGWCPVSALDEIGYNGLVILHVFSRYIHQQRAFRKLLSISMRL